MAFRIAVDAATFATDQITPVTHSLADHPLLSLEKLRAFALRLPKERTRWHSADIPVDTDFSTAARDHSNGRTLEQTIDGIDTAASWVFLQQIELDPEYRALVMDVLGDARPHVERTDPGMRDFHGWIFISSPRAITPYHMDHEANFLLQVRGQKTIRVWDPRDRTVVGERELETFHGGWSLADTAFREEFYAKSRVIEAKPGLGVFMPFTAPHSVVNGAEMSITLSLTFLTQRNEREQAVFAANRKLRGLGLSPRPVGSSRTVDRAKFHSFNAWTRAREVLGRVKKRAAW